MEQQQNVCRTNPNASDVAKYLLEKKGTLTGYQLQKLLYYCQAWSLVIEGKPLFPEDIQAYEHGPAVPSVSMQHQGKYRVRPSDIVGNSTLLSDSQKALVDSVLKAYDGLTGDKLEQLTHSEDPWIECYNHRTGLSVSAVIPEETMRTYYARLLTADEQERQRHHVPNFDHPQNIYVTSSDFDWLEAYLQQEN